MSPRVSRTLPGTELRHGTAPTDRSPRRSPQQAWQSNQEARADRFSSGIRSPSLLNGHHMQSVYYSAKRASSKYVCFCIEKAIECQKEMLLPLLEEPHLVDLWDKRRGSALSLTNTGRAVPSSLRRKMQSFADLLKRRRIQRACKFEPSVCLISILFPSMCTTAKKSTDSSQSRLRPRFQLPSWDSTAGEDNSPMV